jgi:uncharacterized protein YciW
MSTANQPDLFTAAPAQPEKLAEEIAWLEKLLLESSCWMTARDIALTTQGRILDRDIRDLASRTAKIISGQRGYKHMAHSTLEEANHCAAALQSQAKKMDERACAIRRYAHQILG